MGGGGDQKTNRGQCRKKMVANVCVYLSVCVWKLSELLKDGGERGGGEG